MADEPSSSSIRMSWLYFARRSERDSEPVLIWPQLVATARSAMVVSSVSPVPTTLQFPAADISDAGCAFNSINVPSRPR